MWLFTINVFRVFFYKSLCYTIEVFTPRNGFAGIHSFLKYVNLFELFIVKGILFGT